MHQSYTAGVQKIPEHYYIILLCWVINNLQVPTCRRFMVEHFPPCPSELYKLRTHHSWFRVPSGPFNVSSWRETNWYSIRRLLLEIIHE